MKKGDDQMANLEPVYNSEIICPVCEKKIKVAKVRSKFVKLKKQDDDFCPHYESVNPVLYEAWVCSHCGYAAHSTVFDNITPNGRKAILERITSNWTSRDFTGERNYEQALSFQNCFVQFTGKGGAIFRVCKNLPQNSMALQVYEYAGGRGKVSEIFL